MADTLTLDRVVQYVTALGGSVRLIGDDQQLAAIGAGGILRDIKQVHGALQLTELHRFTDPAEPPRLWPSATAIRPHSASTWITDVSMWATWRRLRRRCSPRGPLIGPWGGMRSCSPHPRAGRRPQPARPHPPTARHIGQT